ncbi:hypothetical protein HID58_081280, partial [Brassica napus]
IQVTQESPWRDICLNVKKTLIVWGDKDNIFSLEHGYRLQRLEIIKETGHAVNVEAPTTLNNLITLFLLWICGIQNCRDLTKTMEKLVIKTTEMRKHGGDCFKMLVPKTLMDLHVLVKISTNTGLTFVNWVMYEKRKTCMSS